MSTKRVRIIFTDEVLGTKPGEEKVHEKFVASKAPDAKTREEEIAEHGVEAEVEKTKTIFSRDAETGEIILKSYMINGFFKEIQSIFNASKDDKTYKDLYLTAFKKKISGCVVPLPKKIVVHMPDKGKVGDCQRPLRAETAQGERVALANSETVPLGTWIEFTLMCTSDSLMEHMVHCLNYGVLHGMGQWRNSGKGTFYWEELDEDGNVIGDNKDLLEQVKKLDQVGIGA